MLLAPNIGISYIVGERGFTRDALAKQRGELINGRNIHERALTAIAMYKLAMKYHNEFCPNGNLPSGKTLEDLLLYVRQKMFVHLKGAKHNKSNARIKLDKEGNEVTLSEEDLPDKWTFHGWFVFVLFCPQGLSATSLSCLSEDGSDVPRQSRAETRAKEANVEMDKRRCNDDGTRGMCTQDKLAFASLEHAAFKEETKNVRDLIYYTTIEEGNSLKALELTYTMLEKADDEHERQFLQRRKQGIMQRIDELTERKRKLEAESDRLRMRQKLASENLPQQVSVNNLRDDTTLSSSVSASGSSSKLSSQKKKRNTGGTIVLLNDSDVEEDNEEDNNNNNNMSSYYCQQSYGFNTPVARPPVVAKKPPVVAAPPISKTEQDLNTHSRAVLEAFRAKQRQQPKQPDFGLDYMYDYA